MFKNYLTISLRNLRNNPVYAGINVAGLALGLASCLLIVLYISDEISYDTYHRDVDRIYRIATATSSEKWAAVAAPVAAGLKNDFPEVEAVTRIMKFPGVEKMLIRYQQGNVSKQFYESRGYYADSTIFQVLTYDFKLGNPQNALSQPNTLVLSETLATRLFGMQDPIGKTLRIGLSFGDFDYTVTGVFRDRHKSHVDANFFLSMQNTDLGGWVSQQRNWVTNSLFHTYLKLRENTDADAFEAKLPEFLNRNGAADLKALGISKTLFLQPLADIYLRSGIGNEIAPNGSIAYLYIFGSIALFLLVIACINFMNLSTARSEKRAKEVGVRKVMGAFRQSLIFQFLGESMLLSLFASMLAMLLIRLFLPVFNELSGKDLSLTDNPGYLSAILVITLLTGLLAGLYPAFYLSSFRPASVLKGKMLRGISAIAVRKGLVVFQFSVSIILIFGAVIISQQLRFLRDKELGFDKDQKMIIPLKSGEVVRNYRAFRDEVTSNPGVISASSGSAYPGIETVEDLRFYSENKTVRDAVDIHLATVDDYYTETLGFKILAGRSFIPDSRADSSHIILNEAAVKQLGFNAANAIGKNLYFELNNQRRSMQIVGVLKDFNYHSLHEEIKPYALTTSITDKYQYMIIHVRAGNYERLINSFNASWKKFNPDTPFQYSFLNQDFERNYEKEKRTASIVNYFTAIAIFIACLGLFGLATFSAEQRTKEIGIRKVLGASVMSIIGLLSKEIIALIGIAMVVATPVAWFGMNKWLQDFAYKVSIQWWVMAAICMSVILTALATVSFQSIKAALANPVRSLRSGN